MRDRFRVDWTCTGERYSQPEWQRGDPPDGQNAPVSCSRNCVLRLRLDLSIERKGDVPSALSGRIVGRPKGISRRRFRFESGVLALTGERESVEVVGKAPLPNWPTKLEKTIQWTFRRESKNLDLGQSGPHTVFVTFGKPPEREESNKRTYEEGATLARMREATRRVDRIGGCSSVTLIKKLFDPFDDYVLGIHDLPKRKRREVETNQALRRYLRKVYWPSFSPPHSLEDRSEFLAERAEMFRALEPRMEGEKIRARDREREIKEGKARVRAVERDMKGRKNRAWDLRRRFREKKKRAREVEREVEETQKRAWDLARTKKQVRDREQKQELVRTLDAQLTELKGVLVAEAEQIDREYKEQSGPWPLAVLERYGGECQAIVRFVVAVLRQLGFRGESDADSVEIWYGAAMAAENTWEPIIIDEPVACRTPENGLYTLMDCPPQKRFYSWPEAEEKVRPNSFEAFLRYRYKKDGQFYQAWYGGGVGLVGTPQKEQPGEKPLTQAFERELLRTSFAGVALCEPSKQGIRVMEYWPFE